MTIITIRITCSNYIKNFNLTDNSKETLSLKNPHEQIKKKIFSNIIATSPCVFMPSSLQI